MGLRDHFSARKKKSRFSRKKNASGAKIDHIFRKNLKLRFCVFKKIRILALKTQVLARFSFLAPFWNQWGISSSWVQFWVKIFFLAFFRAEKPFFKNVDWPLSKALEPHFNIFEKSFFGSKKRKKIFFDPKLNPGAGNTPLISKWGQK